MDKIYYYDSADMRHKNKGKIEQIRNNIDEMFSFNDKVWPMTSSGAGAFGNPDITMQPIPHVVPDVDLLKRYKVLPDDIVHFEKLDDAYDLKPGQVVMIPLWEAAKMPLDYYKYIKDNNCYVLFDYVYETYLPIAQKFFCWLFNKIGTLENFIVMESGSITQYPDDSVYKFLKERFKLNFVFVNWFRYHDWPRSCNFMRRIGCCDDSNTLTTPKADNPLFTEYKWKHDFIFLNRSPKVHRIYMLMYAVANGLVAKNMVTGRFTINSRKNNEVQVNPNDIEGIKMRLERLGDLPMDFDEFARKLPIKVRDDCDENKGEVIDDRFMPFEWIQKVPLHLTSETMFSKNDVGYHRVFPGVDKQNKHYKTFVTEKSYKPLMYGRPQIIASAPHHLKALRSMGFDTLDDFIDNSYDKIEDDGMRMKAVLQSFENFDANVFKDPIFIDKLRHNMSVYYNKNEIIKIWDKSLSVIEEIISR
jgi:hypothetical protein